MDEPDDQRFFPLDAERLLTDASEVVAWSWPDAIVPGNLIPAYRAGIFPWPCSEDEPVPWVSPDPRAILVFSELTVPKSLRKTARTNGWEFSIDRAFDSVIEACRAAPRPGQDGTWILPEVVSGYRALHNLGVAHSIEVWEGTELVGGLYGVDSGGVFTGESMFHKRPDASKMAILHLVSHLMSRGAAWMDIQQLTPHMERLGARLVRRAEFLEMLQLAHSMGIDLFD